MTPPEILFLMHPLQGLQKSSLTMVKLGLGVHQYPFFSTLSRLMCFNCLQYEGIGSKWALQALLVQIISSKSYLYSLL